MRQPTLIPTTIPMARRLARLDPVTRTSPALAAAALERDFAPASVALHLSEAMAIAARFAELAASDRPWARALGHARDLVAIAVLCALGACGWLVLP